MKSTFPFKLAYISKPADNDLTNRWSVVYSIWDVNQKKLIRKRVMLAQPTAAERLAVGAAVVKEINELLADGQSYVGELPKEALVLPTVSPTPSPIKNVERGAATRLMIPAINEYLAFVKRTLSTNTYTGYKTSLYSLMNYLNRHKLNSLPLGDFDQKEALGWLDEIITVEKNANRTRNNRLNDVSIFFNYYINRDKRTRSLVNPFEFIEPLPALKHKHQSYSKKQQVEYRKACESLGYHQLLLFCRFIYYTLARPHEEIRRLRVRDLREKVIYITPQNSKTSEGDYIDIPTPLAKLIDEFKLRSYPDHYYVFSYKGEPGPDLIGRKYMYRRHVQVLEKMNLTDTNHDVYSWKHTGALALWEVTNDIELVRRQCRHSDIAQTFAYLRDLGVHATNDKIHQFPEF